MCRILAIPPGFSRDEAIRILSDMEAMKNRDGVGYAYLDGKKRFQIVKYPKSLSFVLRKHRPFLTHLPHDGWTLIHLRAASHGSVTMENTHPFEVGDWAVVHNGIWSDHWIASILMDKLGKIKDDFEAKRQTIQDKLADLLTEDQKQAAKEAMDTCAEGDPFFRSFSAAARGRATGDDSDGQQVGCCLEHDALHCSPG